MSLNKSVTTRRRFSLLAGSSLVAASLTVLAGGVLAPTSAFAIDECGNPSANGAGADVLTCTPGVYSAGIEYSTTSNGDLTVILRDRVNTGTSNFVGSGPIRMYGDTGEDMTLRREDTPGVIGDPRIINTTGTGRAIDLTTLGDGNVVINLTDGDPTAGEPTTPGGTAPAPMRITGSADAIRAEAQGSGAVTVVIAETGVPSGTNHLRAIVNAGNSGSGSGVLARTTTGTINIDTRGATVNSSNGGAAIDAASGSGNVAIQTGPTIGGLYGIRAVTGGAVALTVTSGVSSFTGPGIEAAAGMGGTVINLTGGVVSGSGIAIRAASTSTSATAAVNVQNTGGTVNGRVDFSGASAGGVTFNNATGGTWTASGANIFSGFNDTLSMSGLGQNTLAAGASINFAGGADTWSISGAATATSSTVDFGTGTDTLDVSGTLSVNGLTLNNLETLNNAGAIYMGGSNGSTTDGAADDVLRMASGTFMGSGGRVVMDVLLTSGTTQASCLTPGISDCLDLRGASLDGVTNVRLTDLNPDTSSAIGYVPVSIVIVEAAGAGASAAGNMVLDPESEGYAVDRTFGPMVGRAGPFGYALQYDADAQQYLLVGLPRSEALEYVVVAGSAQSVWHLTAATVNDRQGDLRQGAEGGTVWLRSSGEYAQRDLQTSFQSLSDTYTVDNDHKQYTGTVIGGMDLVSGETSGGLNYVAGVQIGYVGSRIDFDAGSSSGRFTGATGGAYGSLWGQSFFFDGVVNINGLSMDYDLPGTNSMTNTFLDSIGARMDVGFRSQVTDMLFAEPIASLAYVRTRFEEVSISGAEIELDDARSLRGALGLRVGGSFNGEGINGSIFLLGRAWNEFEGETGGVVVNPGLDLPFADNFEGGFGEVELGVNVANAANTLSGFVTSGAKWRDGYSAVNLSLGVRLAW